jgi:hypothetical protein
LPLQGRVCGRFELREKSYRKKRKAANATNMVLTLIFILYFRAGASEKRQSVKTPRRFSTVCRQLNFKTNQSKKFSQVSGDATTNLFCLQR